MAIFTALIRVNAISGGAHLVHAAITPGLREDPGDGVRLVIRCGRPERKVALAFAGATLVLWVGGLEGLMVTAGVCGDGDIALVVGAGSGGSKIDLHII